MLLELHIVCACTLLDYDVKMYVKMYVKLRQYLTWPLLMYVDLKTGMAFTPLRTGNT